MVGLDGLNLSLLSVGAGQGGEVSSSRLLDSRLVHGDNGSIGVSHQGGEGGDCGDCGDCGIPSVGGQSGRSSNSGSSVGDGTLRGDKLITEPFILLHSM